MTERCINQARYWVKLKYSDAYIQSQMWASRDVNTSIENINLAVKLAREEQEKGISFELKEILNL